MATTYGTRCADLLIALGLSHETTIRALMRELGLTYDEAASTMLVAQSSRVSSGT